jgi:hypothetical protein
MSTVLKEQLLWKSLWLLCWCHKRRKSTTVVGSIRMMCNEQPRLKQEGGGWRTLGRRSHQHTGTRFKIHLVVPFFLFISTRIVVSQAQEAYYNSHKESQWRSSTSKDHHHVLLVERTEVNDEDDQVCYGSSCASRSSPPPARRSSSLHWRRNSSEQW